MPFRLAFVLSIVLVAALASSACATKAAALTTVMICGSSINIPQLMPPVDSGPVVLMAVPCFESAGGGTPTIPQAYRRYVELQSSRPSDNLWVPFDDRAQKTMEADFRRLWESGQLSDLTIGIKDYTFPNGVIGKFVTYEIVETPTR